MKEYESLQYKTRGNASPQGRPRVFFCCAAADFDRLFEPVTEELLDAQPNAAIWYLAPGEGAMAGEAFLADLSQMQLLAVPVTTAFLRQDRPDPARTVAFRCAVERHIPVLPLMQEPGLEQTFNELCGDLQFLDKAASERDPTAIPYEEKLRRFLEGVLVSDALAERVRAAFDAYIFLSYRKKDRAAAQKLMRLIHENEFCRDVAIWYDEFLTPGENFNRAIEEAMKKSALFALVVTPNLLEDPNYVLTTEYPAAKRMEKKLLPFEAEPTDFGELARLYDGVRETVPTDDPAEISRRLRALLVETALRKNDDPAHTFLMGVAYLSGIDMEVNHARAVELITAAAEAGLPEALEKLVSMYKTGEGVERNYRTSADWQRRLADCLREAAERDPSEQNMTASFWALCDLGDDLQALGDPAEAEQAYLEARRCAETMRQQNHPQARRELLVSFERLGDTCNALGRPSEALDWYQKGLAIAEALAAETGTAQARRDLFVSYNRIGNACDALGSPSEALEWYQKGLAIAEALAAETGMVEARRDLFVSYNKLGEVSNVLGNPSEAEALEWYQKALAIAEALAAETRTVQARRDLSITYNYLGNACYVFGDPSEALDWYLKAFAIAEALAAETGMVEARRDLSLSFERLGMACNALSRPSEALDWYQKRLAICEALAAETGMVQARRDLTVSYHNLGDVFRALNRPGEALEWHQKALAIAEALAAETGTVQALADLVNSCYQLGSMELIPRAEREAYLRRALRLCEQLLQKTEHPLYQYLKELITQALASL